MTYDRTYVWSKEFYDEIENAIKNSEFKIVELKELNTIENIKLPTERKIKIQIQKSLSKFDLMNYGEEFAQVAILKTQNPNENITVKGWCLSDHLMGIEVEYENIDAKKLNLFKETFEKQFSFYKIIWTDLKHDE